ncbi:alpha/beta hydrolase [Hyphococcus flavus]|uniref:Alpha/beta hydrolase n=1 Tax=Hyphococcus flavus TaxID=1866326 RepID=A0AAE9ZAP0_9PROT|nr:alpha/beta hydrolase [Hyphococcus flavus]WDI30769.1 alpha/beta hydrolase [Hyphococcus flavus]
MRNPLRRLWLGVCMTSVVLTAACAQENAASSASATIGGLPRAEDRPLENIDGVTSHYGMVETSDGAKLRTIITIPANTSEKPHPLLFTQWVSCGSIEFSSEESVLARLAQQSGLAVVRVERSSNGDSIGPACDELDYDTEVAHYVEAFSSLLDDEKIDASKVYVYGSSLGSTTAPLVTRSLQARGRDIAGVVVQGGGAETYYERMLTFDRLYLERRPDDVNPEEIHDEMVNRARFHYEYLIRDRHPDEVANDSPAMAAVRDDVRGMGADNHYGRPFQWHQQAAKHNFLAAWAEINAPVLVIYNEYDQFEGQYGHQVIADMVNRLRPGTATFIVQDKIDHSNDRYDDPVSAYAWEDGSPAWDQTAGVILNWLETIRNE